MYKEGFEKIDRQRCVFVEDGSNNDPKLMEVAQNFMAIKFLNFLYLSKCMFQTPPCGIQW
jgi:hypothetical protein